MKEDTYASCKIKKMDDFIVSEASVNAFLKEWGQKGYFIRDSWIRLMKD